MSVYAANTSVSVERSRAEIETILGRYGAEQFGYASEPGRAQIMFKITGEMGQPVMVRMTLTLPPKSDFNSYISRGYPKARSPEDAHKAWEQACRSLWRSLCLVIKAKLEAVECKISTVEREFLADIMLPSGRTVAEETLPQLPEVYRTGGMPRLLLGGAA